MDVGLNNKNLLGKEAPELADVVFLVKANSNEQFNLWVEWSKESLTNIEPLSKKVLETLSEVVKSWPVLTKVIDMNDKVIKTYQKRIKWKQISSGFLLTIGHVKHGKDKLPICIEFSFAIIEGKKVCFYNRSSRAGDSKMVDNWLIKRFQLTHDGYTRWNHVNATNFHNCVNSLDKLDKEPRDTKYKIK